MRTVHTRSLIMSSLMKRVLVLGSGFTSGPLVEYLVRDGKVAVTVASNIIEQAQCLAKMYQNTKATTVDVNSERSLGELVRDHDLVVSYVPFTLHPVVAKQCIHHKVSMVTASYATPALQAFDQPAKECGITMLHEVGLDPGIDHMLAMQCFDEVKSKGGKIISFESWCGGLPHPDCASNPLKYKFSWSPRAVLTAALRPAKFIRNGMVCEIQEGHLMEPSNVLQLDNIVSGLEMEGYYNTDSTKYIDIYQIPEAKTVIRGTLRYKGFCSILQAMYKLGLLSVQENQRLMADAADLKWKDLMAMLISQGDVRQPDLKSSVYCAVDKDDAVLQALENLRLLSDDPVEQRGTPLDALCAHLQKHLQFQSGEKDAIYLHHIIGIEWPNRMQEVRHINLTKFGEPNGFTAMAKTVGKPTAIAAKMILSGDIPQKGVITPTTSDIYNPILENLKQEGITASTYKS